MTGLTDRGGTLGASPRLPPGYFDARFAKFFLRKYGANYG